MQQRTGFTILELLIVLAILAVVATIAVVIINPAELSAEARDASRLDQLSSINRALEYADVYGLPHGAAQTVYVSIPDTDPACATLGLPPLNAGWNYACAPVTLFRRVDGTGWIPINFKSTGLSIFATLPVDPINTVAGGYYYTYVGGSWVLTAGFESTKFRQTAAVTDGGTDPVRKELGSNIMLWSQSGAIAQTGPNTAPTATVVTATTAYNTPVTITLSGSDPEQCDLTFTVLTTPANGSVSAPGGQSCTSGAPNLDAATVVYTPNIGFSGANSFTYQVNDGAANSTSVTVSITVGAQTNTVPTAANGSLSATTGVGAAAALSATDGQECDLSFSIVSAPAHGTVSAITNQACLTGNPNSDTASVTYTATGGYTGADSFTYKANDGTGDSNTATVNITVSAASPTVTSISPGSFGQGAAGQIITINGSGFVSGASVSFSGTGVTVNSVTFVSAAQLTANIAISGTAATGARTITVTNPNTLSGTCAGCFTVNASPTVVSASPASAAQGASGQNITIAGTGFSNSGGTPTVSFSGTGITVNSVAFVSATQLTANITISGTAATGARTSTVVNPDAGSGTCVGCFTVTSVPITLAVTSASPSSRGQGAANQMITITGTGFSNSGGTPTMSFSGTGITVNSVTFVSAAQLTADITVSATAATGAGDITVTNPDTTQATCTGCFTVNIAPSATSVSPPGRGQGAVNQTLTINGTGFSNSGGTPTVSFSGTGITVNSMTFVSATQITANVTISANAATGARSITVVNPDGGTRTTANAFTVNIGPTPTSANPSSANQGATVSVTIAGSSFVSGSVVSFSGSGVTINSTIFVSATQLTVSITIASGATTGARDITVTNPNAGTKTCTGCFTVTAASGPPTPNHWWKLDDGSGTTAADSNGIANGTVTNMESGDWATGKSGAGFSLDFGGTDEHVALPSLASDFSAKNISIGGWVNPVNNQNVQRVFDDGTYIYQNINSGSTWLSLFNGSSYGNSPATTISTGAWTHIIFTYDGATLRTYKNGVEQGSGTAFSGGTLPATAFKVGCGYNGAYQCYVGKMDEFQIYNRALSATEVLSLYQSQ